MTDSEIRDQCASARAMLAMAIAEERRSECGPQFEFVVGTRGGRSLVTLRLRQELLSQGAREALDAGLMSLWNADDASTLRIRTGRTIGEAARSALADLQTRGDGWVRVYGDDHSSRLDDTTPEVEPIRWYQAWHPDVETPEEFLSRILAPYAGRIVSAGLRSEAH